MTRERSIPRGSPLLGWISISGADAVGRILLQVVSTIIFARWLSPEVFGMATLTVVVVSVLSIFASAPFEEALTQRKIVRTAHFASCLFVVLGVSLIGCILAATLAHTLNLQGDAAVVAPLVALFSVVIFAEAVISIYTAIARRHRAFNRVAWSNLAGHAVGTVAGLALAFAGVGVWSLLALRMVSRFTTMLLLVGGSPVRPFPRFSVTPLRELSGFASWSFGSRVMKSFADAVFQGLVARYFGLAGAGYLNMALRIVEPIRGATGSIGHNISMSYFVREQDSRYRLRDLVAQALSGTGLLLLPVFVGLAAAGPSIIDVIAGPGWEASHSLVIFLALGAAATCCTNFLYTGLLARGHPELAFFANALELAVMVAGLWLFSFWGLLAAGLARFLSHAANAVFAVFSARNVLQLGVWASARLIAPLLTSAGLMGCAVFAVSLVDWLDSMPAVLLIIQVSLGVLLYGGLTWLFHAEQLRDVIKRLQKTDRVLTQ